jgi:hypothetical protein
MKTMLKTLALLAMSTGLLAEQTNSGMASVAAPYLKLPSSARVAAMGEAGSALSSLDSLSLNPAGLAGLKGIQATFLHNEWIQGMKDEHLAAGMGLPMVGAAMGLDYYNMGPIDRLKVENNKLVSDGTFNPSAIKLEAGAGLGIGMVSVGLAARYLTQTLDSSVSADSAFAGDLGARFNMLGASAGLSVINLGSQLAGADLPRTIRAGVGYEMNVGISELALALDVAVPTADTKSLATSLGAELWLVKSFALRAGYKAQDRAGLSGLQGLSAGVGAKFSMVSLDYAMTTLGDLGTGNLFSLNVAF